MSAVDAEREGLFRPSLAEVHGKVTKDTGAFFRGNLQQQMRPRDVRSGAVRKCGKNLLARYSGNEPVLGGAEIDGWNCDGVEDGQCVGPHSHSSTESEHSWLYGL